MDREEAKAALAKLIELAKGKTAMKLEGNLLTIKCLHCTIEKTMRLEISDESDERVYRSLSTFLTLHNGCAG